MSKTKWSVAAVGVVGMMVSSFSFAASPLVDVAWIKEHSCDANVRV